MSDEDLMGDVVERLEWDERREDDTPHKRLKQVTRRTALTGGAAGIAALALQACGSSGSKTTSAKASTGGGSRWPSTSSECWSSRSRMRFWKRPSPQRRLSGVSSCGCWKPAALATLLC